MSKAKKKKIKARKYEIRMAQKTAERIVTALEGRLVKFRQDFGNKIKSN